MRDIDMFNQTIIYVRIKHKCMVHVYPALTRRLIVQRGWI